MKNLGYNVLKYWVKGSLHCYYGKIKISGKENVPKNKPVLFLPNHHNALLDVLLLAVDSNRKPWFLTRADVFKKPRVKKFFAYLQMIAIYRIRDGRKALKKNDAVFNRCAELLEENEAILMFPEANHNIKRRVRPLSKGFTRILFGTLDRSPDLDIQLIPVGLNYKDAQSFPDHVGINFGKPISLKELYNKDDVKASTILVKEVVADSLKTLTTHIEDEESYESIISQLNAFGADYLKPAEVNRAVAGLVSGKTSIEKKSNTNIFRALFKFIFTLLNLPLVLGWRYWLKPKVWEPEFTGTLRFGYALLAAPVYYLFVFVVLTIVFNALIAVYALLALFTFNWGYVKLA